MKRVLFLLVIVMAAATAHGQMKFKNPNAPVDTLPYQKYPTLPAFNILLTDSSTIFNTFNIPKGKPIVLMYFDPDCRHCKEMAKLLFSARGDSLSGIRFYLVTLNHSMKGIKAFADELGLTKHSNVEAIGRDYEFFFPPFYGVRHVPDFAIYDSQKRLIKLAENFVTVEQLYELTKGR